MFSQMSGKRVVEVLMRLDSILVQLEGGFELIIFDGGLKDAEDNWACVKHREVGGESYDAKVEELFSTPMWGDAAAARGLSAAAVAGCTEREYVEVTESVATGPVDDEHMPITRCFCGKEYRLWDMTISILNNEPTVMPCCGRRLCFEGGARVYQVFDRVAKT